MPLLQWRATIGSHHLGQFERDGELGLKSDHTNFKLGKRLGSFARRHYSHQNQPVGSVKKYE
jgi:hypothetical protein